MRFGFGKNWISYSRNVLDREKISQAREGFLSLLDHRSLRGCSFIDIGFGQGLDLMLAVEAGAQAVGIDLDEDNIVAVRETAKFFPNCEPPQLYICSIMDLPLLYERLGGKSPSFDIVYSWGVLHHTGDMWSAIRNACSLVKIDGLFVCSIYQTHWSSPVWWAVKYLYNLSPFAVKKILVALFYPIIVVAKFIVTGKNPFQKERGMDFYHDVVDWIGGYPYEYAASEEVIEFVAKQGFGLVKLVPTSVPTGCNQCVFKKVS